MNRRSHPSAPIKALLTVSEEQLETPALEPTGTNRRDRKPAGQGYGGHPHKGPQSQSEPNLGYFLTLSTPP